MKAFISFIAALCLLAACSDPDHGPELGDFPAISKKETDPAFTLAAPSSRSPAPMTFTSSNPAVATIDGTLVTIRGVGESTITAAQKSTGSFGPTSKSAVLTVTAVPCETGQTRVNGICRVIPTCVSPATLANAECRAPSPAPATPLNAVGRHWMGTAHLDNWTNARDFCRTSVIENVGGWRLPTADELASLFAAGEVAGSNWTLGETWSDTNGTTATGRHVTVNLSTGERLEKEDGAAAYVSCVRE